MKTTSAKPSDSGSSQIRLYPPSEQGTGGFDGGRITEIKPIGFPGEGAAVTRIGPLFYWAWATSNGPATIALHPHRGFEIVSYVLDGEVGHFDTGGHEGRIGTGGVQVMQTGSGIAHEERTFGPTDFFQIWFEPDLREAVRRAPAYYDARDADLPVTDVRGVRVKSVVGGNSPIELVVDAQIQHLSIDSGLAYRVGTNGARTQAVVVIKGDLELQHGASSQLIQRRDFLVVEGRLDDTFLKARATGGEVVIVDVPTSVSHPLLSK